LFICNLAFYLMLECSEQLHNVVKDHIPSDQH
jgi:hypothetical protein